MDFDKLNEVGLETISLKIDTSRSYLNDINLEFEYWKDNQEIDSKYMINIYIDIIGIKDDTEEKIKIGYLEAIFFEADIVMNDATFYDVCDYVGRDLEPLASAIVDHNGYIKEDICEYDENLMYIDRIFVEKAYRGLGIASYLLSSLNQILAYTINLNPHVLILLPKPQEKDVKNKLTNITDKEKEKKYKSKLINLYQSLGFQKIRDTEYMIKRVRERFI